MTRWLASALAIILGGIVLWAAPERASADESATTSCEFIRVTYPKTWNKLVNKGKCPKEPMASSTKCANNWFPCDFNTPVGCGSSSACDPIGSVTLVRTTQGDWKTKDGVELKEDGERLFDALSDSQANAIKQGSAEYSQLIKGRNLQSNDISKIINLSKGSATTDSLTKEAVTKEKFSKDTLIKGRGTGGLQ